MTRVFSGMQPSGDPHLGNLLGALAQWVVDQHRAESLYCVVDLHALTSPQDPAELRARTLELATTYLAVGIDPKVATVFVQSHVHEHAELAWIMQCTAAYGELSRMTQFKDKSDQHEFVSGGLFTYPTLMAADILLYDTDQVPVGDDQRQHLELTRDLAIRFNSRYGDTFVVPEGVYRTAGARVMDLQQPTRKMSKSLESPQGTILLADDLADVARKVKRAVTDTDSEVRFDVVAKPGVSNLLSILAACTGADPAELAGSYTQYGPLKADTAEAVVEFLRPIKERYGELSDDPGAVTTVLADGADRARELAAATLSRARDHLGLLPRG
jgi:tryptophanyl-tRNA synthetase